MNRLKSIKSFLLESYNDNIERLIAGDIDELKIDEFNSHAIITTENLSDGELSLYLSEIWSDVKGKGFATLLLNKIKSYSDSYNIPLSLRASTINNIDTSGGMDQKTLVDWYIKNGFKISEGDNNFESEPLAPFMIYNY